MHNVPTEPLHLRIKGFRVLLVTISVATIFFYAGVKWTWTLTKAPDRSLDRTSTSTGYTISMINNLNMLYNDLLSLTRVPLDLSNFHFLNRPGTNSKETNGRMDQGNLC